MAEALGRVEVEISANTAQFEAALARARALAAGLKDMQIGGGGGGAGSAANALKNFNNSAQGATSALAALIAQNKVLAVGFHTVAGALSAIQGPLGPIAGRFGFLGTLIGRVGVGFAGFGVAVAGAVLSVNEAIDAFAEEEKQLLTLNAVLKATQGASGQTAGSLADLADAISTTTLATDDQVRSAEALMLTFRKISGEEFPRAMRAAQDLAATGFGSIEGNARQLGRALEDPVRGLGALRRSGVTFSESQRTLIKSLVESGNIVEAQRKVLQAIEIQVGGAGAAQAGGVSGAYHRLSEAVNNVTVSMGGWLERTLHVSAYADSAANALNSMVQGTDDLAVSIGGVTYQTKKLESAREESDRKQKERLDYAKLEFEQAAADAAYEAQQQAVLRFAQTPQVQGKAPVTFTTGFEADAVKTDEQIKLQNALTAAIGQFAQAISYAHQAVTGFMADYAALKKAEDALNQSMEGGLTALREERDELMRTNEQRRIHDVLVKNELNNNKEQARTLAAVTAAQFELNQAISDLASAGGPVDELKARYASMLAMMQQGAGIQMTQVGILKVATNTAIALTDEQIRTQERADALSRGAKNAVEQKAAAEAQEAAKFIEGETEKHRLQRITVAGHKAELDAINSVKEADESRILQQKQNLENAQLDLELVGKSIGEQTRLRTEVQLTQELQRRQILEHIAYTKEDIKAVDELAAKMGDFAQKTAAANLQMQTDFESQSMFLSQTEQKVAQAMQGSFGDQWQAHMHDATANQIRFNAVLQDTYSATRDFAGTFTEGMLAGKSATDALTDALGNLQKKLIDMALDAVIQGLFGLLLGKDTTGGNIFSNLVNVASGGGTSANTSKAPRRYADGGVVGSTPRPLYKGEPLAYDEYPAILHTGETVVPVGGKNLHLSGKDMTEMFGGVPKLEGGWNAAAEAAGGYQAGDTGATGHWGTTSGGGGNVSLSNLAASQFTSTGGGSISLGSGHGGGGGSISIPIPRLRIAAPRIAAPAPIVVAPVIAPVVVPDVVPLPRENWTQQLLDNIPDFSPLTSPEQLLPDVVLGPASRPVKTTTVVPSSTTPPSRMIPTTATPPSPAPYYDVGADHPSTNVRMTTPTSLGGFYQGFEAPAGAGTFVGGHGASPSAAPYDVLSGYHPSVNLAPAGAGSFNVGSGIMPQIGGFHTAGSSDPATAGSRGLYPILNMFFMQSALADRMDYPADVPLPRPRPLHHEPFASQLGYGAGLGAARYPFRIATDPRKLVKNVIAPTNPDIDVIPPVFGGLPVQPGLGLYPPPPGLPLPRSDATMGPMTQIDTGKTGFGQVAIPVMQLFNRIFGIGQSNQPLPEPAPKAPAPYDDGGAKANIKEQYDSIMKNIKRGSTGPSSMFDARGLVQLAGYFPANPYFGPVDPHGSPLDIKPPAGLFNRFPGAPGSGQRYYNREQYERVYGPISDEEWQQYMNGRNDPSLDKGDVPMSRLSPRLGSMVVHAGGVVGSTPTPIRWVSASMFDHAPRFQAGLAANEYPAILHAGETVTPVSGQQRSSGNVVINTPAQAPPNVTVNVVNNSNAQVSTDSQQDGSGGVKIDIMIDEMVAAKMRDGGSLISRTLGSMGTRAQPVRR